MLNAFASSPSARTIDVSLSFSERITSLSTSERTVESRASGVASVGGLNFPCEIVEGDGRLLQPTNIVEGWERLVDDVVATSWLDGRKIFTEDEDRKFLGYSPSLQICVPSHFLRAAVFAHLRNPRGAVRFRVVAFGRAELIAARAVEEWTWSYFQEMVLTEKRDLSSFVFLGHRLIMRETTGSEEE